MALLFQFLRKKTKVFFIALQQGCITGRKIKRQIHDHKKSKAKAIVATGAAVAPLTKILMLLQSRVVDNGTELFTVMKQPFSLSNIKIISENIHRVYVK
jgi:hypothetical protein